jgi:thiol-disulfide isomerase/thioredoxin
MAQGQRKAKTAASLGPKVTQIDIEGLKKLIKPNGKPLILNFWATWCDPCREEFPDLVKINTAYKGKVDLVTVSLDDLAEINRDVPKFLIDMKAEMPAYLLKTADEDAAMKIVTEDWAGNLPMTIMFSSSGELAYIRKGKLHLNDVTAEIDKVLGASTQGRQ